MTKSRSNPKVAYLVNVYPAPSHSFIRREILALEEMGWEISRYTFRRTESPLHDPQDQRESQLTEVLLDSGAMKLGFSMLRRCLQSPIGFLRALRMTWRLGRRSEVGIMKHVIYLAEACLLQKKLVEKRILHLHAHFGTNSATVALLCYLLGGPGYSVTIHGPEEFDRPTVLGLEEKIRHSKFIVGISQFGRSQLFRWCDLEQWKKIHVVHCGLDRGFFEWEAIPVPDKPVLVCVGRLCEQKGQLLLVQALAQLKTQRVDARLVLVGDGPMRQDIEQEIKRLDLTEQVSITGWASGDTVKQEIANSRIFVLPSFAEGLPVVIMEALAMERPVISTYVAGIPELVQPGVNGWLVPAGDVDALASAMREALETPFEQLQQMGRAGRQRVLERHNIQIEVAKLAELFRCSNAG